MAIPANYLWAIPLLPLLGAIINGIGALTGKLSRSAVNIIACSVVMISFLVACFSFFNLTQISPHEEEIRNLATSAVHWIAIGDFKVNGSLVLDPLSAVMILVITGIGSLIHLYSTGYMSHEHSYARYFAYLNLFTCAMLILVMGENVLMMFVGWEGVGVCSYLLIGFWYQEIPNAEAGKKAFIVNRVGDFGFVLGAFLLFWTLRHSGVDASFSFSELRDVLTKNPEILSTTTATAICLLLFVGATGKSAQIPLYVWLPDAMAGPTPVSALIHAATMVTAGVYMITRLNFLFVLSPFAMTVIACIGALTAFFAATIGLTQTDIKKVLAYSTVSQLGYMFLAVGVGAFTAGMFHLITHAFFKACLFLGSGSVIHAMGGEQDMRKMGGLKKHLPITYWTFLFATIAIAGVAGTAGFMSKDEILAKTLTANEHTTLVPGWALWIIVLFGAFMTTFYMFRLVFMTFHGKFRGDHHTEEHLHESPMSMVIPLIVLSFLSIFGGLLNVPRILTGGALPEFLHEWVHPLIKEPHFHHIDTGIEIGIMFVIQLMIAFIIYSAYYFYVKRPDLPPQLAKIMSGVPYKLSFNKYYIDEIYQATIVTPLYNISRKFLWPIVDAGIIDGVVKLFALGVSFLSECLGILQSGKINKYAFSFVIGIFLVISCVIFY